MMPRTQHLLKPSNEEHRAIALMDGEQKHFLCTMQAPEQAILPFTVQFGFWILALSSAPRYPETDLMQDGYRMYRILVSLVFSAK